MSIPPNKNPLPGIHLSSIHESLKEKNPGLAALLDKSGILNKPNPPTAPTPEYRIQASAQEKTLLSVENAPADIDTLSGDVLNLAARFEAEEELLFAFGQGPETPSEQFQESLEPSGQDFFAPGISDPTFLEGFENQIENAPSFLSSEGVDISSLFFQDPSFDGIFQDSLPNSISLEEPMYLDSALTVADLKKILNISLNHAENMWLRDKRCSFLEVIRYIPSNIRLTIGEDGAFELVFINYYLDIDFFEPQSEDDVKFLKYLKLCEKSNQKLNQEDPVIDNRFASYIAGVILKKFIKNPESIFIYNSEKLGFLLNQAIALLTRENCQNSGELTPYAPNLIYDRFVNSKTPADQIQVISIILQSDPESRITFSQTSHLLGAFCKIIDMGKARLEPIKDAKWFKNPPRKRSKKN